MKLGKLPKRHDRRTLKLSNYLKAALPTIPDTYDWATDVTVPWGQMMNDTVGDCTCAAAGHLEMIYTGANGDLFIPTDAEIIAAYSAITGYNPADPSTDTGADELTVLNYWKNNGIAGHQIGAYAEIDPTNVAMIKAAIYLFGGTYLGVQLPICFQGATQWDRPADITAPSAHPGSWGGHAVPAVAYDADGVWVITWGQLLKVQWSLFASDYPIVEEAYAIFSPDFVSGTKPAPNGFDQPALQQDLNAL